MDGHVVLLYITNTVSSMMSHYIPLNKFSKAFMDIKSITILLLSTSGNTEEHVAELLRKEQLNTLNINYIIVITN